MAVKHYNKCGLTARYDIESSTGSIVRFDYRTADGDPPKQIRMDGKTWNRRNWIVSSRNSEIGLVWYQQ